MKILKAITHAHAVAMVTPLLTRTCILLHSSLSHMCSLNSRILASASASSTASTVNINKGLTKTVIFLYSKKETSFLHY